MYGKEESRVCTYPRDFFSTLKPNLTVTNTVSVQVGINYTGTGRQLNGCVNDAKNVRKFLTSKFYALPVICSPTYAPRSTESWNFKSENIIVLTDDTQDPRRLPTRANILGAMKWLVKDAKAHDSLFFHCESAIYISEWFAYVFQTPVMADRSVIPTAMRLTDMMKVGGEDHREWTIPNGSSQSSFLLITNRGVQG